MIIILSYQLFIQRLIMSPTLTCNYPAEQKKCNNHRLANRIFKDIKQSKKKCECCGKIIGQPERPYHTYLTDLARLGPGVPILFISIKNGILLLLLLSIIFTIYALVSNILGTSCQSQPKCIYNIFNRSSIVNKINDTTSMVVQSFLVMLFTFLYNILLQYFIYRIRKTQDKWDKNYNTPSDYSIIIRGLPYKCTKNQITQMINERMRIQGQRINEPQQQNFNSSIYAIELSYPIQKYLELVEKEKERYVKAVKNEQDAIYQIQNIPNPKNGQQTSSFAIVIFNKQCYKQKFIKIQKKATKFVNRIKKQQQIQGHTIRNKKVHISRAPEPDDIIWQNSDTTYGAIIRRKIVTNLLCLGILTMGGVVQYFLQDYSLKITDGTIGQVFSFISSITIIVINKIIVIFLLILTQYQKNWTMTELNASILNKICLFSFFNAGIFYPAATILATQFQNFNFQGTFSYQIQLFIITSSLSSILVKIIFTKLEFPQCIKQYLFKKKCLKYSQQQANALFQMPQPSFPQQYAYVIKTIWLSFFYAPLVPIVVPISIIGLILFYLSENYLFKTSYSQPNMLSIDIAQRAIFLMNFTPLLISLGQIAIVYYIKSYFQSPLTTLQQIPLFGSLFFSLCAILIPSKKINKKLTQELKLIVEWSSQQLYKKASQEFETNYQIVNPVTNPGSNNSLPQFRLIKSLKLQKESEMTNIETNQNTLLNSSLIQNQQL